MMDTTLIADLVRAGVDAELVGRVANALASVTLPIFPENVPEISRNVIRAYERNRKRNRPKSSGKQTMSADSAAAKRPGNFPESAQAHSKLSSFLSFSERGLAKEENKKERSSEFVTPNKKKGTRLSADWELSEPDRKFARDHGVRDIDGLRGEFIDYWIGVPGQRGFKLNWSATWRNRVRTVASKGHVNGQRNATMAAFDNLIARAASDEIEANTGLIDVTPNGSGSR